MGKVKIKRKSTLIDMTAMSDVTVLLLTFFMLTSTFLQKEPQVVVTPSSVSEEKVPMNNFVTLQVSSADKSGKLEDPTVTEGKVFLSFAGDADSTYSSSKVRAMILDEAVAIYNRVHPNKQITLDGAQRAKFAGLNMVGVNFEVLPEFLSMPDLQRDKFQEELANPKVGIPMERYNNDIKNEKGFNQLQIWCQAIRNVAGNIDDVRKAGLTPEELSNLVTLADAIQKGEGIGVKADKDTPFEVVHDVFDNLQTMGLNKFSLMTALKSEDEVKTQQ